MTRRPAVALAVFLLPLAAPAADPPPPPGVEPAPGSVTTESYPLRRYPPGFVRLAAGEPVLGLSVGGEDRAYVVGTFDGPADHLAADEVGGRAVAVTYCDRWDCGRVFDAPGPLRLVGFSAADGMLLGAAGRVFAQHTGRPADPADPGPPLAGLPALRTTWGEWAAAHPATTVAVHRELSSGGWKSVYSARMATVPGGERVAGVTVGGMHRAYLLCAFDRLDRYVVHDFLADVPLAVAFDPETGRTRAFRAADGNERLPVTFAGWRADTARGGLLLDFDGRLYDHDGRAARPGGPDRLPFAEVPVTETTWAEWVAAHPGTSFYAGDRLDRFQIPVAEATRPQVEPVVLWTWGVVAAGAAAGGAFLLIPRLARRRASGSPA